MKKLITTIVFGALYVGSGYSQDNAIVISGTKMSSTETPQEVINGVKQKFPDAKAIEYYKLPKGGVSANGWQVTANDNLGSSDEIDKYSVSFKRGTVKYYALYDKDGTLLQSRYENSNADLPEPVKASLMNLGKQPQYVGYTVKSKSHYDIVDSKGNKNYYVVVASNGDKKVTLYYTADGTIIKSK